MNQLSRVSEVIGKAYDAALEPSLWPGVLQELSHLMRSKAAAIQLFNPVAGNSVSFSLDYGTNPVWTELLHTTYAELCPIGPIMMFAEIDEPANMFDYIDEAEFVETRFYKEWCAPQDYYHFGGSVIAKTASEIGTISFYRGRAEPHFGPEDYELITILCPHVRRAVTIANLFKNQAVELSALTHIMNQLSTAILIVDGKGRLIKTNAAADVILAQESIVQMHDGRLALKDGSPENGVLETAIETCSGRVELVPLRDAETKARLMAAVMPIDAERTRFAVMIHNQSPVLPAMGKPLAAAFGFSRREVAVLMPFLEGNSPAEVASLLGVSLATVRSHLASLYAKTGTERQADLVRVVIQAMPPVTGNT